MAYANAPDYFYIKSMLTVIVSCPCLPAFTVTCLVLLCILTLFTCIFCLLLNYCLLYNVYIAERSKHKANICFNQYIHNMKLLACLFYLKTENYYKKINNMLVCSNCLWLYPVPLILILKF